MISGAGNLPYLASLEANDIPLVQNTQHSSDICSRLRSFWGTPGPAQDVMDEGADEIEKLVTERDAYRVAYEEDEDKIKELVEALERHVAEHVAIAKTYSPQCSCSTCQARGVLTKYTGEQP